MIDKLVKTAHTIRKGPRSDDSKVDRLSCRYTVIILLTYTILLSLSQWVRNPMTCWFPKNFDIIHREYLHSHCWVQPLYYLPYNKEVPKEHEDDNRRVVLYYQWIPLILLSQAFFFWLPSGVWHALCARSGLDTRGILGMTRVIQDTTKQETKDKLIKAVCKYLDYYLLYRHGKSQKGPDWLAECCHNNKRGRFLTVSYCCTKFLYVVNLVVQVLILSYLLQTQYYKHGANHIWLHTGVNTTEDGQVWNSPVFPRIAFCDYIIRSLGNNRRYSAQCVLPLNIYIERLYLVMWFWLTILLIFTVSDLFVWTLKNSIYRSRLQFVRNRLQEGSWLVGKNPRLVDDFTRNYLRADGTFILYLIAHNTSSIIASDVTGCMWDTWMQSQHESEDTEEEKATSDGFLDCKPWQEQRPPPHGDVEFIDKFPPV